MSYSHYYIKVEQEGIQIKLDFLGDELHTTCFMCGKEFRLDGELIRMIVEDGDFMSTRIGCGCNADPHTPTLTRIK